MTKVVSEIVTYCPEPTVICIGIIPCITVDEPTMLTITDCPCTVTEVCLSPHQGVTSSLHRRELHPLTFVFLSSPPSPRLLPSVPKTPSRWRLEPPTPTRLLTGSPWRPLPPSATWLCSSGWANPVFTLSLPFASPPLSLQERKKNQKKKKQRGKKNQQKMKSRRIGRGHHPCYSFVGLLLFFRSFFSSSLGKGPVLGGEEVLSFPQSSFKLLASVCLSRYSFSFLAYRGPEGEEYGGLRFRPHLRLNCFSLSLFLLI